MAAYFRPSSLAEALAIRARQPVTVLAGGTDVYPARANRVGWGDMRRDDILDISAIAELKGHRGGAGPLPPRRADHLGRRCAAHSCRQPSRATRRRRVT